MKILSAKQIYAADKITIKKSEITSLELMERAGGLVYEHIVEKAKKYTETKKFVVVAGVGNNGGDGLVIARWLYHSDRDIQVYIIAYSETQSIDFRENLSILPKDIKIETLSSQNALPTIPKDACIIDAIFGIGISRPLSKWLSSVVEWVNGSQVPIFSVDIPSGLPADAQHLYPYVRATHTFTFECPKLSFFLPQNEDSAGEWKVIDIGLDREFIDALSSPFVYVDQEIVKKLYAGKRATFSHKGTYGHTLIIGGSYGKVGAVVMAVQSALRSGSGLVSSFVPYCGYGIMQTSAPEAMTYTDKESNIISDISYGCSPTAVGIGIGMGIDTATASAFGRFLKKTDTPIVVDADAITILSLQPDLLHELPSHSILTPHPGELKRLIGEWKDDAEKIKKVLHFVQTYNVILVLKGAYTFTFYQESVYINSTGNPGMATGGSGDVLLGIITSLLAQGYTPLHSALLGVYLHGAAGDYATQEYSEEAMIATDIIAYLGRTFRDLAR